MKGVWRWRGEVLDVVVFVMAVAAVLEILLRDLPRPQWLLPAVALYTLPPLAHRRRPFAAPAFVIVVQTLSPRSSTPRRRARGLGRVRLPARRLLGRYNPLPVALGGLALALSGIVVVTAEDVQVLSGDAIRVAVIGSLAWAAAAVLRRFALRAGAAHLTTETTRLRDRGSIAGVPREGEDAFGRDHRRAVEPGSYGFCRQRDRLITSNAKAKRRWRWLPGMRGDRARGRSPDRGGWPTSRASGAPTRSSVWPNLTRGSPDGPAERIRHGVKDGVPAAPD